MAYSTSGSLQLATSMKSSKAQQTVQRILSRLKRKQAARKAAGTRAMARAWNYVKPE